MIIGLDCDGVLASFRQGWIAQYNEWFNARIEPDAGQEDWSDFLTLTHFHDESDFWAWVDRVPDFWTHLPPVAGAMGGVMELLDAGHQLCIITHRKPKASAQTTEWLRQWWPRRSNEPDRYQGVLLPTVHFARDKTSIPCQLYVDDSPRVIERYNKAQLACIKFRYPYNRHVKANAGAVDNWKEFVALVAELQAAIAS